MSLIIFDFPLVFKISLSFVIMVWFGLIHYSECHVALDRNPEPAYDTLLLRLIPGDLLSPCLHRQFHPLPGLLDSRAALQNSYLSALCAMQGGSLYHFYDGLWYHPAGRRTHDLPCERRTRQPLIQPDTVCYNIRLRVLIMKFIHRFQHKSDILTK